MRPLVRCLVVAADHKLWNVIKTYEIKENHYGLLNTVHSQFVQLESGCQFANTSLHGNL